MERSASEPSALARQKSWAEQLRSCAATPRRGNSRPASGRRGEQPFQGQLEQTPASCRRARSSTKSSPGTCTPAQCRRKGLGDAVSATHSTPEGPSQTFPRRTPEASAKGTFINWPSPRQRLHFQEQPAERQQDEPQLEHLSHSPSFHHNGQEDVIPAAAQPLLQPNARRPAAQRHQPFHPPAVQSLQHRRLWQKQQKQKLQGQAQQCDASPRQRRDQTLSDVVRKSEALLSELTLQSVRSPQGEASLALRSLLPSLAGDSDASDDVCSVKGSTSALQELSSENASLRAELARAKAAVEDLEQLRLRDEHNVDELEARCRELLLLAAAAEAMLGDTEEPPVDPLSEHLRSIASGASEVFRQLSAAEETLRTTFCTFEEEQEHCTAGSQTADWPSMPLQLPCCKVLMDEPSDETPGAVAAGMAQLHEDCDRLIASVSESCG
eukprot:TRINITY_DN78884_c0_g1_i1.p1 TRINITY_DN78884_c0_g1~~TRINITY_DN78884_c0_g1_i1.p1  ORF type:complete len:503 (-),score=105.53 TRINITY_DN78884_c0_g1_i1:6-1325(-)